GQDRLVSGYTVAHMTRLMRCVVRHSKSGGATSDFGSKLSKPYVRFSREQKLVAPAGQARTSIRKWMSEARATRSRQPNCLRENFLSAVALGDQNFRSRGPEGPRS